ncbi:MAG: hypothetical protein JW709_02690, partial [Sedimentisphaerales bacterium]|nr:hypothetical protein [Sedimentisphaerales bacterium]
QIDFDDDYEVGQVVVEYGDITFNLGGWTYQPLKLEPWDDAVVVGDVTPARLSVTNGTVYCGNVTIGRNMGSSGELVIGADTWWEGRLDPEWQALVMGWEGDAHVVVQDGGVLRAGSGTSAARPWVNTQIEVMNPGTELYIDGYFGLGDQGRTELMVTDEALTTLGYCEMGIHPRSFGYAEITGTGSAPSTLEITNWTTTSLWIGKWGRAEIYLSQNGKLLNWGQMAVAAMPGSWGALTITDAGTWADARQSMYIGGTSTAAGGLGVVVVRDGALLTVGEDSGEMVIWPAGNLFMDWGEVELIPGGGSPQMLTVHGRLNGGGMIWADVMNTDGVVAPGVGAWANELEIGGDYTQSAAGTLEIVIQAAGESSIYGNLRITNNGVTDLNGFLRIILEDYTPQPEDVFEIILSDTITGQFINAIDTYTFESGTFDVIYTATTVQLTNFSATPTCTETPAYDLNHDCRVNLVDLAMLAAEWLSCSMTPPEACGM